MRKPVGYASDIAWHKNEATRLEHLIAEDMFITVVTDL